MCVANALFERLWKLYPNKKGKGQVSDTQKKRLLAIGEPTLVKAIERYSLELQKDADWRKPQNGSTFLTAVMKTTWTGTMYRVNQNQRSRKTHLPQAVHNVITTWTILSGSYSADRRTRCKKFQTKKKNRL